jgi:iron-sulfur cluster repair protein YtfE (RIC family)
MEFVRQISRKLHEEHVAILDLLGRFEQSLARLRGQPPATDDPVWRGLLSQLDTALQYEVTHHFDLEEEQLFPRLHQRGEGDLAELLFEEHEAIRAVAGPLLGLIARAAAGGLDGAGWKALKVSGLELVERLGSHARKEEEALVPLVDEMLDEQTDRDLWSEYAEG